MIIPDGPPMIAGTIHDGLIRVIPMKRGRNPARPPYANPHRLAGTSGHYRHVRHVHVSYQLPDDVLDPKNWINVHKRVLR